MSKFCISVLKDTNRVIASSESDWAGVKPGSYLKIANDSCFYSIAKTREMFFIKDFSVIGANVIKIDSDTGISLLEGDTLSLSFKEWQLSALFGFEGGSGYRINDVLIPSDGCATFDKIHGNNVVTKFKVDEVDNKGKITSLSLMERGKYLTQPSSKCSLIGGEGTGVVAEIQYELIDDRMLTEAVIEMVDRSNNSFTLVRLNYPVPNGASAGKLSTTKFEIILSGNYIGESKFHVPYSINKDFTPNLDLPLLVHNNPTHHLIFNKAMNLLDDEIKDLQERLAKLEAKV